MTLRKRDAKGEAGRAGMRSGVPAAARVSARTTMRRASSILKALSPDGFASGERRLGRAAESCRRPGARPASIASAARARHGFAATPPSASRASRDRAVLDPQRSRGRHDGEGVGGALADLQIARMRREAARLGRQPHRDDEIAGLERAVPLGRVAGQAVQRLERDLAPAVPALDLDDGVERDQRHAEIGRMGGDAGLAPAEHGMQPVLAVAGIAARAGLALVAGAGGVVEIGAARPLQQIAADGRGVAQLRGRAGQQRFGDGRDRRARNSASCARSALRTSAPMRTLPSGKAFDAVEPGQRRDVDEAVRAADAALHQVEQIGAGGQIGGARLRRGGDGLGDRAGLT